MWHVRQIVCFLDSLHEMSSLSSGKNKENIGLLSAAFDQIVEEIKA